MNEEKDLNLDDAQPGEDIKPEIDANPAAPEQESNESPPPAGSAGQIPKADPVKRIIAFVIDAVISMIVGFVPFIGAIIGAAYMLLRDALPIEALNFKSVGKKLINLKVINESDPSAKIDYATSAKRNWMFALGPIMMLFVFIPVLGWIVDIFLAIAVFIIVIIEVIKLFTDPKGKRIGDNMAQTMVIEDR